MIGATADLFDQGRDPVLHQWFTPEWAADRLVERHFADLDTRDCVLEPSAGRGAFLKAIPAGVPAIGVEIDPALAAEAEAATGRRVLVGDFRTIRLPVEPTVIVGNPPFDADVVDGFLARARGLLPDNGRCGFLLPAYLFQTPRRVARWGAEWSMAVELVPRTLFMRSRLPLVFALFTKARVRVMVGLALYDEASALEGLAKPARLVLVNGRPRRSVWAALVVETLGQLGGRASLAELYHAIEPRRPTPNAWWREKVRQTVQNECDRVGPGEWALRHEGVHAMSTEPIKLDAGDVLIEPLDPVECEDCIDPATKVLSLDLRNNGQTIAVGAFCDGCIEERAERLRASLPPSTEVPDAR